jgi:Ni/Co efflux regulator RcnB
MFIFAFILYLARYNIKIAYLRRSLSFIYIMKTQVIILLISCLALSHATNQNQNKNQNQNQNNQNQNVNQNQNQDNQNQNNQNQNNQNQNNQNQNNQNNQNQNNINSAQNFSQSVCQQILNAENEMWQGRGVSSLKSLLAPQFTISINGDIFTNIEALVNKYRPLMLNRLSNVRVYSVPGNRCIVTPRSAATNGLLIGTSSDGSLILLPGRISIVFNAQGQITQMVGNSEDPQQMNQLLNQAGLNSEF